MHSYVTSKNVKWCHLIWPTLYVCMYVCPIETCIYSVSYHSLSSGLVIVLFGRLCYENGQKLSDLASIAAV